MTTATAPQSDVQMLDKLRQAHKQMRAEIGKIIIGQEAVLDELLMAIFCRSHALLVGVPGLAKTLMVSTLAQALDLHFKRIQFTPDLMPSDITGTEVIQDDAVTRQRMFKFMQGPIFSNIVLADEINRTPPKTQAALLEAMQERSCTVRGHIYPLPAPFFVLATQNPIELEGTYPPPEAQLDRFLFNAILDYLSASDELKVVDLTTTTKVATVEPVTTDNELLDFQQLVRMVPIGEPVAKYVVNMVRATRYKNEIAPDFVKKCGKYGGRLRAEQNFVLV